MDNSWAGDKAINRITSGIDQKTLVLKTINFVQQQLPSWRDDPDRPHELSENRLNLQLCKFLDSRAREAFPMVRFDHEEYQAGQSSADMSASPTKQMFIKSSLHTIYDPVLIIECKRLPAPSKAREKEYVTGGENRSGGIQRFKLGLHGAGVEVVAMIGYVQGKSARYWKVAVNKWISELSIKPSTDKCVWKDDEKLNLIEEDLSKGLSSYHSVHRRTGSRLNSEILIQHLWIAMSIDN